MVATVLLFLALLSILVIVHEWGHYTAARKLGMIVEEFGLGFPPRLFSWKDKKGTTWSINLIPLGGFVRIQGENGEKRFDPGSFASKGILARFTVLIAGVVMNLVTAAVLFSFGFLLGLPAIVEGSADKQAIIHDQAVHVVQVIPDAPAAQAGLKEGDKLLSIDGESFTAGEAARQALVPNADGSPITVVVQRGDETIETKVVPTYVESLGKEGVGVAVVTTGTVRYPWYIAPVKGVMVTADTTYQILAAFGGLIGGLAAKEDVAAQLSGPVGIAVLTGQVAELGFAHLVQFAAMLSVNLAVLNALPFPALDGGRIFFLGIEAVRRKPVSQNVEQAVHALGFALLLLLVVFVTYRDIVKFF